MFVVAMIIWILVMFAVHAFCGHIIGCISVKKFDLTVGEFISYTALNEANDSWNRFLKIIGISKLPRLARIIVSNVLFVIIWPCYIMLLIKHFRRLMAISQVAKLYVFLNFKIES